jgi:EPS-associated MarR family transcriptional regulator
MADSPDRTSPDDSEESTNAGARLKLLRAVASRRVGSQRELASALGLSLGKTNFLVHAVLERGWVKVQNFRRSDNKRGYLYFLTPSGIAEKAKLTQQFIERKEAEFAALQQEIAELRSELPSTKK